MRMLAAHWADRPPDLVVSLVPHFNRALGEGLHKVHPEAGFVTLLTDIADYPPHFWMERQEQFFICGSQRAVEQARALGHPDRHIFRTSGMILSPRFYNVPPVDRAAERRRLGLDPEKPTGLVLFGGQGSRTIRLIARQLDRSSLDIQLILICGRNEKLAEEMRSFRSRLPLWVEGFTTEVPFLMQLSDFFLGKPGPGSISEALAMGLPVIVERNAWTLPQERYNADWIVEQHLGVVVSSFREVGPAVEQLLQPDHFPRYRSRAAALTNRAVFEIPAILETILQGRR
jgi:1,2-diacylglycerol 3-beta-galactosyltransferase